MNTSSIPLKKILEACLLTSNEGLSLDQLSSIFDNQISQLTIDNTLAELQNDYTDRGIELIKSAAGYRFRSRPEYNNYLHKLNASKPPRYSRATMETLAIIAYRQPVTRGEIEDLRGVLINSTIIQQLFERDWIEVVGHKQLPGKPELLATTKKFLADLGLETLAQLPPLPELEEANSHDLIEVYTQQKELTHEHH